MGLMLDQLRTVVTHPGQAHRDEFMAIGLVLALREERGLTTDLPVERREPTTEEMADPAILVVDIGGQHDPALSNFDHHQFERGTVSCSLSLVAEAVGLDQILGLQDWYEITSRLDSTGPFQTAKWAGLERFPFELSSPVETAMLEVFATNPQVGSGISCMVMLNLLRFARKHAEQVEMVRANAQTIALAKGVDALVFDGSVLPAVTKAVRDEILSSGRPVYVLITHDDRGDGWTLYRFDDSPRVDFASIGSDPRVLFAHKGGFIAKTRERLPVEDVIELGRLAVKPELGLFARFWNWLRSWF